MTQDFLSQISNATFLKLYMYKKYVLNTLTKKGHTVTGGR